MLALFTGLPGAGKTLNLIKYVSENKDFANRPKYYFGINGLDIDGWTELSEDQVHTWYELTDSPVILIDEVQKIWRQRGNSAKVPFDVQQLETHRHLGIDIFMTCQDPMQIDHGVRKLVQMHWHFDRPANIKQGRKFEFERCISDPYKDRHLAVQTSRYKIDKQYFDCYKSAETHTHTARLPKKFFLVIGVLILCALVIVYAIDRVLLSRTDRIPGAEPEPVDQDKKYPGQFATAEYVDPYLSRFKSRYDNLPFSKPFYDEMLKPTSYPYIAGCMNFRVNGVNDCSCQTLQGAKVPVSESVCLAYVENGEHDFTQSDQEIRTAMSEYLPTGEPCCGSTGSQGEDQNNQE